MDVHLFVKCAVHHGKAVLAPSFRVSSDVCQFRELSEEVPVLV